MFARLPLFMRLSLICLLLGGIPSLQGCTLKDTQSQWQALQQKLQNPHAQADERPPLVKALEVLEHAYTEEKQAFQEVQAAALPTIHPVTLSGKKTGIQLKGWLYDPIRTERLREEKEAKRSHLEEKLRFLEGKIKILKQAIANEEELDATGFKLEKLMMQFEKTHQGHERVAPVAHDTQHKPSLNNDEKTPSNAPHQTLTDKEEAITLPEKSTSLALKRPVIILCHGLGQTHLDWGALPTLLSKAGYVVLNLDLPGHGESTTRIDKFSQKPVLMDWRMFDQEAWFKMDEWLQDALQALFRPEFEQEFPESPLYKLSFIGSGYGGLLAMTVAGSPLVSQAPEAQRGVFMALSPPLSQKGVEGLFTASNMVLPSWIAAGEQTSSELLNARKYCRIIQASCALAHFKTSDATGLGLLDPHVSSAEKWMLTWLFDTMPAPEVRPTASHDDTSHQDPQKETPPLEAHHEEAHNPV